MFAIKQYVSKEFFFIIIFFYFKWVAAIKQLIRKLRKVSTQLKKKEIERGKKKEQQ